MKLYRTLSQLDENGMMSMFQKPINPSVVSPILIYLTGGVHWMGGIQYTRNLLRGIALLPAPEKPQIVLKLSHKNAKFGFEQEFIQYPNLAIDRQLPNSAILHPWFWKLIEHTPIYRLQQLAKQKLERKAFLSDSCPVAFPAKGANIPGPSEKILWVPDFQYKNFPEYFSEKERQARDEQYDAMFKTESILVLSSQAVKADFFRFFPGYNRLRVRVLPFHSTLVEEDYHPHPYTICQQYGLPEVYAYLPNQIWQHKGHDTVLAALVKLKQTGLEIPIVCTGNRSDYRSDLYFQSLEKFINTHNLDRQVFILDLIPRQHQIQVFRQAALIIQPSRSEGWSTVVEDARALGKTILLSDIPVHQEQAPEEGHFFQTGDAEDLEAKLGQLWPNCLPGVQPEKEEQAKLRAKENSLSYARNFLQIVQEAYQLHLEKLRRNKIKTWLKRL